MPTFRVRRPEYDSPAYLLSDVVPWWGFIRERVLIQKNPVVQKTFAFRGHDLASSSPHELIQRCQRLNNAVRRLGTGWTIYVETQRRQAPATPSAKWQVPAAALVDRERRKSGRLTGYQFESSHYITFVWRLPSETVKNAANLFYEDTEGDVPTLALNRDLDFFERTVAEQADILRGVFARVDEMDEAEVLTYLHSTISMNNHPVVPPQGGYFLDAILPDMSYTPGDVPQLGDHFIPTAVITHFPPEGHPAMLADLDNLGLEYRHTTRFECLDSSDAEKDLSAYRRMLWAGRKSIWKLFQEEAFKQESALLNNAAANKAADADAALQCLGDDLVSFGRLTSTITVWDRDLGLARQSMLAVKRVIQSLGMVVRDETLNSQAAWLGSLPGHVYSNVRRPLVSSINFAHLTPISSVWPGDPYNEHLAHLTGERHAHIYCSTDGATPFNLNLNVGDVGHTLVIGPAGSGKSTLVALLALQFLRYPHSRVVVFDKDRSCRAATLACGGRLYEPGNPHAPVSFQPLAHVDDPSERQWASQFILSLLETQLNQQATPAIKTAVDRALDLLADRDRKHRTLLNFADALGSPPLARALRPYTLQGSFGQVFDADNEDIEDSFWMMFEMGPLMALGPDALIPGLEYLFHRVERSLDGRPTIVAIDECWRMLEHPTAAPRLKAWAKEFRKRNVYLIFATQHVADAISSPIMPTLLSECKTKIFLPNASARSPLIEQGYRDIGLDETEISIIASGQPKRDYFYASEKGRRLFSLDMGPVALAFAGMSSEDAQHELDEIVASTAPERYAHEILRRRGLTWGPRILDDIIARVQTQGSISS